MEKQTTISKPTKVHMLITEMKVFNIINSYCYLHNLEMDVIKDEVDIPIDPDYYVTVHCKTMEQYDELECLKIAYCIRDVSDFEMFCVTNNF